MANTYCTVNTPALWMWGLRSVTSSNKHNQRETDAEEAVVFLTKKGRWGNCTVAAGYHDTDARFNKWHREVDDFRTLFVYSERANGHVSSSIHNLRGKKTVTKIQSKALNTQRDAVRCQECLTHPLYQTIFGSCNIDVNVYILSQQNLLSIIPQEMAAKLKKEHILSFRSKPLATSKL